MRRIPPLPAIRVFEAAARHENFTAAAAELGMTQAAVSYQIRLLEERVGGRLFLRSKRRVTLSEAGRKIAPMVTSAFDTLQDAFATVVADDAAVLAVSTATTFASNWLAPRIGGFQILRPDLAVRLHASDQMIDFARDEFDVAVRGGRGGWPGLHQHFLFQSHFTPMCSPDFLARNPMREPCDLLGRQLLSPDDEWWPLWFSAAHVTRGETLGMPGVRLDSQVMEANAAMSGHGIAILNPVYWQRDIAAGRLVLPFSIIALEGRAFWLVYPEHKRNAPKVRAFRDWILSEVAAQAAQDASGVFHQPDELPSSG